MSYLRKKYISDESDTNSDNSDDNLKNKKKSTKSTKSTKTPSKKEVKVELSSEDEESEEEQDANSSNSDSDSDLKIPVKKSQEEKKELSETDTKLLTKYNKLLKKYWGYDGLKPTQFEVIKKVIVEKKDVSAILATGFGKSLCYQLPYLITEECVIVVSPLIALMHEQGQEMENKKIPVAVFNSDSNKKKKEEMKKEILTKQNKLIYMTPEYLITAEDFIKELADTGNLAMVCIDEAHAVSTWGLDFRPGYTKLGVIRTWAPSIPILTLTATASTKVREDIVSILKLYKPELIIGNFDRPNLLIRVQERHDDIMTNISDLLDKYTNEYIIIYCKTRDETDALAKKINDLGINCGSYHAGMSDMERQAVQQDFIDGDIKCIIATIAFGMGINIPNVRLVVHYNCPKNIESYYQEIGRAGRDGKPSECVLFYSTKDFKTNRFFLKSIQNPAQLIYQEKQIKCIEKYVYSPECRRKLILENFGQKMDSCTNCDNCLKKIRKEKVVDKVDYTIPVILVLNVLNKINDKFGQGMSVNILLGKKSKVKEWMEAYPEYGNGIQYGGETWWKTLLRNMINDDLIQETQARGAFFSTMSLTTKGANYRSKIINKYPKYSDIMIAQSDESSSNSYSNYQIKYPPITPDPVKTRTNKSTKGKTQIVSLDKINLDEKPVFVQTKTPTTTTTTKTALTTTKVNKSTKPKKPMDMEVENLDDLDDLIATSSNRLKKKLKVDSDSD